mgnify:CR=1 FL=1
MRSDRSTRSLDLCFSCDFIHHEFSLVFRDVRESWIKTKYVDKRFVKPIIVNDQQPVTPTPTASSEPRSINRRDVVRKWSVRKVRKRPQKNKHSAKLATDIPEEKAPETDEKSVIVFGDTENNEALDTPLFVSSDEDSATSEDSKLLE